MWGTLAKGERHFWEVSERRSAAPGGGSPGKSAFLLPGNALRSPRDMVVPILQQRVRYLFSELGELAHIAGEAFRSLRHQRPSWRDFVEQLHFIGVKSQSVVITTGAATGMVRIQAGTGAGRLERNATRATPPVKSTSPIRELRRNSSVGGHSGCPTVIACHQPGTDLA